MTKEALQAIVDRMAGWPEDRQEAAIELFLTMDSWGDDPYPMTKEDLEDLRAALKETDSVPYEKVKTQLFDRYR